MALTNAELEYIKIMPLRMKAIEKQLERIADILEKVVCKASEGEPLTTDGKSSPEVFEKQ